MSFKSETKKVKEWSKVVLIVSPVLEVSYRMRNNVIECTPEYETIMCWYIRNRLKEVGGYVS